MDDANATIAKYKEREAATAAVSPTSGQEAASAAPKATSSISFGTVMAVFSLLVGAIGVYYQREAIQARLQSLAPGKKENAPSPPVPSEPAPAMPRRKGGINHME